MISWLLPQPYFNLLISRHQSCTSGKGHGRGHQKWRKPPQNAYAILDFATLDYVDRIKRIIFAAFKAPVT